MAKITMFDKTFLRTQAMLFEDRAYTVRIVGADGANILGTSRIFLHVDVVELIGVITLRLLFSGGVSFVVPAGQTIHSVRIMEQTNAISNDFIEIPINETSSTDDVFYVSEVLMEFRGLTI